MAGVTLEGVSKVYGGDVVALWDVNVDVADGEFVVFVGPSGCGKSTALRVISGLEETTSGRVLIGNRVVNGLPPRERDLAMVFQNYALYPHMSVRDNMGFALKLRKMDKVEVSRRVNEAARILSIERLLDRKPGMLSGGQRQRVALGRAIVREPKAFLMDEPLSNLDARLRVHMRAEISRLRERIGTTTVYVTHDQTEAMTMADRIVVLRDGVVQQIATPQHMYDHPANVFVAGFIGSPAMNFIRARLEHGSGGFAAEFGETRIRLDREVVEEAMSALGRYAGSEVILGIRPEHIRDAPMAGGVVLAKASGAIEVEPRVIESTGAEEYAYFPAPGAWMEEPGSVDGGLMVARLPAGSRARVGHSVRLVVDASRVRLFDPETECAIL